MTTPHIQLPVKTVAIVVTSLAAIFGFIFKAAPVIHNLQELYHHKDELVNSAVTIKLQSQKVSDLESKVHALELSRDSLKMQVKVLSHGKSPYDSLWILTNSGWKLHHRSTRWIWRRDPDR